MLALQLPGPFPISCSCDDPQLWWTSLEVWLYISPYHLRPKQLEEKITMRFEGDVPTACVRQSHTAHSRTALWPLHVWDSDSRAVAWAGALNAILAIMLKDGQQQKWNGIKHQPIAYLL